MAIGVVVIIVAAIALGEPLYVLIGGISAWLLVGSGEYPDFEGLKTVVEMTRELSDKEVLLAIPFFVISGALMSEGDIARRLIAVARALFAPIPGSLAVSAVTACVFFAAISGSSPVTVIAIGSILYPALVADGYSERFSAGLLTSAGSLGILIPPSIPMIVYAIIVPDGFRDPSGYHVAGPDGTLGLVELFLAGIGPGILIGAILAGAAVFTGLRSRTATSPTSLAQIARAFREGSWSLMLPVLILGGIYTGIFTPTQAAAVSVAYALVVELYIHRSLSLRDLPRILSESTVLIGSLLIILALAQGFNKYLTLAEVGPRSIAALQELELTPVAFLLILNLLLLVVGCFMDILSAILILVPLVSPIAFGLGIHPMHLAIIVIVNLEIGYLTPPVGLNLFVASTIFRRSIGDIIRSVAPFVALMLVGLAAVTYIPTISLGLVAAKNGQSPLVPFPERKLPMIELGVPDAARFLATLADDDGEEAAAAAPSAADPGRPLTIEEMMAAAQAEQEAEALGDLEYETLQAVLEDFRAVLSGRLQLSELGEER
ncbi:MAG: TRAP transporter large permease subunit [Myxococcales bacterium]|nr:TRAP transporter large permease subunit [Myxococcales bacterium]MCB9532344.1 TRAP transporter large permease subunit [Myxococcales bacterium]